MKKFRYYISGVTRDGKAALCFLCAVVGALGIFGIGRGGLDSFITENPEIRFAAYIIFGLVGLLILATLLWKMWERRFNVADWTAQILLYTALCSTADLAVFYGTEIFIPLLCAAASAIVLMLAVIAVRIRRVDPSAETLEIVTGKPNLITYAAQLFRGGSLIVSIGAAVVIALFVDTYLRQDFFSDIKVDPILKFAALIVLCLIGVALVCGLIQRLIKKRICLTDGVFFTLTLAALLSLYPILSTITTLRIIIAGASVGFCLIAEIALIATARLSQYVCAEQSGMKAYARTFVRRVPIFLVSAFALVAFFLIIRADELGFWLKFVNTPVRVAAMIGGVAAFLLVCFAIGATARSFGMFDSFTLFLDEVALLSVARCLVFESSPSSYAGFAVLAAFGVLMTLFRMGNAYVPGFKEAPPAPIIIELNDSVRRPEGTETGEPAIVAPVLSQTAAPLDSPTVTESSNESTALAFLPEAEPLRTETESAAEPDGDIPVTLPVEEPLQPLVEPTECENDFVEISDEFEDDTEAKTRAQKADAREETFEDAWVESESPSEAETQLAETESGEDRNIDAEIAGLHAVIAKMSSGEDTPAEEPANTCCAGPIDENEENNASAGDDTEAAFGIESKTKADVNAIETETETDADEHAPEFETETKPEDEAKLESHEDESEMETNAGESEAENKTNVILVDEAVLDPDEDESEAESETEESEAENALETDETESEEPTDEDAGDSNVKAPLFALNPFPAKKSYLVSLRTLPDELKGYYSEIKNELLRYSMRARISEHKEEFRRTGVTSSRVYPERKLRTQARLIARKNVLRLYLNIDPETLDESRYHQRDVSDKRQFRDLPTMLRVSSRRMADRALELIAYLAGKEGFAPKKKYADTDFTVELSGVGLTEFERNGYGYLIRPYASLDTAVKMSELAPKAIETDATLDASERFIRAALSTDDLVKHAKFGVVNLAILRDAGAVQSNCNYLSVTEGSGLGARLTVRANEFTPAAALLIALTGGDAIRETEAEPDFIPDGAPDSETKESEV